MRFRNRRRASLADRDGPPRRCSAIHNLQASIGRSDEVSWVEQLYCAPQSSQREVGWEVRLGGIRQFPATYVVELPGPILVVSTNLLFNSPAKLISGFPTPHESESRLSNFSQLPRFAPESLPPPG
jgi:hypothetical protein